MKLISLSALILGLSLSNTAMANDHQRGGDRPHGPEARGGGPVHHGQWQGHRGGHFTPGPGPSPGHHVPAPFPGYHAVHTRPAPIHVGPHISAFHGARHNIGWWRSDANWRGWKHGYYHGGQYWWPRWSYATGAWGWSIAAPNYIYLNGSYGYYWYYCQSSNSYYPDVTECPEGWNSVTAE